MEIVNQVKEHKKKEHFLMTYHENIVLENFVRVFDDARWVTKFVLNDRMVSTPELDWNNSKISALENFHHDKSPSVWK